MRSVTLPNRRITTQLGFGCGPLHGGLQARHSRRIIDVAFEAGIRHFDVAPPYGLGLAEGVIGAALHGHRDRVTITGKAGIARPAWPLLMSLTRSLAKPLLGTLKMWRSSAQSAREAASPTGRFDVASVRASLGESLSRLRTDRLDIFLMHEARIGDVGPELVDFLQEQRAAGVVGAIGTGTSRNEAAAIAVAWPPLAEVRQFRWSAGEPRLSPADGGFTITHGAIQAALARLDTALRADPGLCAQWSRALDLDLADSAVLADALLAAAVAENKDGIVLVHSLREARVRRFVAVASDAAWLHKGAVLAELLARPDRP